jgi:hypothetical protein
MIHEYLQRVLPPEGNYFLAKKPPQGGWQQKPFKDLSTLESAIHAAKTQRSCVYVAQGTFKSSTKRDAGNVELKKTFYIDIDCDPKKPTRQYDSVEQASVELVKFLKVSSFPKPNIIVSSGHGLHCYWVLSEALEKSKWQRYADGIRAIMENAGLRTDKDITTDAARVLRVPGTINYKYPDHPKKVETKRDDGCEYDLSVFDAIITDLPAATPSVSILPEFDDEDALSGGINNYGDKKYHARLVVDRCNVMHHAVETGGKGYEEVLWHQQLHLLAFCVDGHEYAHKISSGYEKYRHSETEYKFNRALEKTDRVGPTLCKTLASYCADKCDTCRFNGKIKTPLVLGVERDPLIPSGFITTATATYRQIQDEDGNTINELLFPYVVEPSSVSVVRDYDEGLVVTFKHKVQNEYFTGDIPINFITGSGDKSSLGLLLSKADMILTPAQTNGFKLFMTAWVQQLQQRDTFKTAVSSFGWHGDNFAIGDRLITPTGDSPATVRADPNIRKIYKPMGSVDAWKKAAQFVINQNRPEINAIIATAFGAPLVKVSGVAGMVLSIVSQGSGTGKSTALRLAQSVWGNPNTGINALHDTTNSVAKKLGTLKNLPAYWDEIRIKEDVQSFIKLVFQLAQGKDKTRLNSSSSTQETGSWKTLIAAASNESILEHIDYMVNNTTAGRMRVLEMQVSRKITSDEHEEGRRLMLSLDENYGGVGVAYAEWLAHNHKMVSAIYERAHEIVKERTKTTASERYWTALAACVIGGAICAKKAGIIDLHIPMIRDVMVATIDSQRIDTEELERSAVTVTPGDLLNDYLSYVEGHVLITDALFMASKGRPSKITAINGHDSKLRLPIKVQATLDGKIRVVKAHYKKWLYEERNLSPAAEIKKLQPFGAVEGKVTIGYSDSGFINKQLQCFDIDLKSSAGHKLGVDLDLTTEFEDNSEFSEDILDT